MKEARIIIPYEWSNAGADVHANLKRDLLHAFGGYTETPVCGSWMDGELRVDDVSRAYDVAIEPNPDQDNKLMAIALKAGRALAQKAVYIRFSNGMVKILDVNFDQQPDEPEVNVARKPAVGEIWKCRDGTKAAVVQSIRTDGNYSCITLTRSDAVSPGYYFSVRPDGRYVAFDMAGHPLDLVQYVTSY